MDTIAVEEFERIDIRCGTILEASAFPQARKPAYKLRIDFGPLGILTSSAQITKRYTIEELSGKQIIAVVNFPARQIGPMMSECLVLGVVGDEGDVVLVHPDVQVRNGQRIA